MRIPTMTLSHLSLLPPPSHVSDPLSSLISTFHTAATLIEQFRDNSDGSLRLQTMLLEMISAKDSSLGTHSFLEFIRLPPHPPSSAPPPAPSPQEELQLLCTSFDAAFTSLAGQVKELTAKVNSSGPPPQVATAKKPSAQPPSKPHAQPPTSPAPTPASHPAPPSFASVVKAPVQPSLVMALCPSTPGADVPLATH